MYSNNHYYYDGFSFKEKKDVTHTHTHVFKPNNEDGSFGESRLFLPPPPSLLLSLYRKPLFLLMIKYFQVENRKWVSRWNLDSGKILLLYHNDIIKYFKYLLLIIYLKNYLTIIFVTINKIKKANFFLSLKTIGSNKKF